MLKEPLRENSLLQVIHPRLSSRALFAHLSRSGHCEFVVSTRGNPEFLARCSLLLAFVEAQKGEIVTGDKQTTLAMTVKEVPRKREGG